MFHRLSKDLEDLGFGVNDADWNVNWADGEAGNLVTGAAIVRGRKGCGTKGV
jgi:hypothetical protein